MISKAYDEGYDFGFSAVSETELKALERQLQAEVATKTTQLETVSKTYEEKLDTLYRMVIPLLQNLAKDADSKEYIYWPNRQKKMKDFIDKVEKLVNG